MTALVYAWLVLWIACGVALIVSPVWHDAWPWLGLSLLFGLLGVGE